MYLCVLIWADLYILLCKKATVLLIHLSVVHYQMLCNHEQERVHKQIMLKKSMIIVAGAAAAAAGIVAIFMVIFAIDRDIVDILMLHTQYT